MMPQGLLHQMVRYGMVGVVIYMTDFVIYAAVLYFFPGTYLTANALGKVAGAATGFVLHRRFTFSWKHKEKASRQFIAYIVLFSGNIAISSILLWILVDLASANKFIAKLMVDIIVIIISFIFSRLWVYRPA